MRELFSFGDVLQELVKRDIKVRYKRSVLGIFWTMLNPLLMMVIMTIVFQNLFRQTIPNFPIYVLSGYIVWAFFSQSTTSASTSVLDSAGLTRKVYLPPALLPLASIVSALVNLLLSLIPLALLMLVTGGTFTPALIMLPFSFLVAGAVRLRVGAVPRRELSLLSRHGLHLLGVAGGLDVSDAALLSAEIIPRQYRLTHPAQPALPPGELVRAPVYAGQCRSGARRGGDRLRRCHGGISASGTST